mgnify:CR=1 FL=1
MVRAILEGRKTQTRRTKGLERINDPEEKDCYSSLEHVTSVDDPTKNGVFLELKADSSRGLFVPYPYGAIGDLIWVRETFLAYPDKGFAYKASTDSEGEELRRAYVDKGELWCRWKPSIHMPKEAARIWLMVEEVRVERLQDISEEDAIAEGVEWVDTGSAISHGYRDYMSRDLDDLNYADPTDSFDSLWESINGEESWEKNPWVWVVKFRVLSTEGKPSVDVIRENWESVNSSLWTVDSREEVKDGLD